MDKYWLISYRISDPAIAWDEIKAVQTPDPAQWFISEYWQNTCQVTLLWFVELTEESYDQFIATRNAVLAANAKLENK